MTGRTRRRTSSRAPSGRVALAAMLAGWALVAGCGEEGAWPGEEARAASAPGLVAVDTLSDSLFAALHARISEEGGYFDTDNLISNESGYLNVMGALGRLGVRGGVYVGVGPDQNYSYIAGIRPEIAFITDVRRDNVLQHLLLKALMEASPTRVEFLSALHGRTAPSDPEAWRERGVEAIVAWVDGAPVEAERVAALHASLEAAVQGWGLPLSAEDLSTIRDFHQRFIDAGLDLRFTSHGRRPQPYYPTYRKLVLETDAGGEEASYLASAERYGVVRELHQANRIVPVVADLAGPSALQELGRVMREMGVKLTAFYVSNVEYYLWRDGTFPAWSRNLASLPAAEDAVIIRSYFPRLGGRHPSALPGYYATQMLQPVRTVTAAGDDGGFRGYGDLVTRDLIDLRAPAGSPR